MATRQLGENVNNPMIVLEGVSKSYIPGVAALNDINVRINKGEFVFIVGDSSTIVM